MFLSVDQHRNIPSPNLLGSSHKFRLEHERRRSH